jgi:hypothetical protein
MAAELGTAATFDGGHHLELAQAEVAGMRLTPHVTPGLEDIRDLQGPGHGPAQPDGSIDKASRGLWASRRVRVATWLYIKCAAAHFL